MDRQRVDKWLWHARLVRTRTAAAALADRGHIRINGQRVSAASHVVRLGDVVTVALDRRVRVLKVSGFALRRGSAEAARALSEELTPAAGSQPAEAWTIAPARREPGTGRPTKRQRRAIDRFTGETED